MYNYEYLHHSRTADKWQKIGIRRRAGVAVPLFSIYSEKSTGIGEIPDMKLLIDWCKKAGLSILQLLPLNDVGNDFSPYNSLSTFALDPMYISLQNLKGVSPDDIFSKLHKLKKKFRPRFGRVDYRIKKAKLELLREIFHSFSNNDNTGLSKFINENEYWLEDYALYKVISESMPDNRWELWNDSLKNRNFDALNEIEISNKEKINFYYWVQWQLYEQLKEIKSYAEENGVFLMGDLSFLVSRESADVWSHQDYFFLELSAGAPPDMYFALGQNWGMPPYCWENIARDNFVYPIQRLKYAEQFYHLYRIDHFVGLFRVWVNSFRGSEAGGSFLPSEQNTWEAQGRRIIDEMLRATTALPCAEDLGTVPECSPGVLYEYGIPGIDFQRFMKSNFNFRSPFDYRPNSCAVLSTHDSTFFANWWLWEAGTIDEKLFETFYISLKHSKEDYGDIKNALFEKNLQKCGRLRWNKDVSSVEKMLGILQPPYEKVNEFAYLYLDSFGEKEKFMSLIGIQGCGNDITIELIHRVLKFVNLSRSIFSIQLLHDYLCLDEMLLNKIGRIEYRINTPGRISRKNWSQILPISLENLADSNLTSIIREIVKETNRV